MFLQQLINGLTIGSTYALVAIGFSMVFGVIKLTNFANGSLYMLGAYLSLMLYLLTGNFVVAFLLSLILTGTAGYCLERFALRYLRKKHAPNLSALITTLGMSMIMDNFVMLFFGSETKSFPNKLDLGRFYIGNAVVSWTQVIILAVAFILMTVLSLIVYKTKLGKAMLSTSQNMEAAKLMGVNINGVISFTFICSGVLACISGTMVGMYYQAIDSTMGAMIGMKIFASAILGGVGMLPGAVVGGLCMGVIETIVAGYMSSGYRDAIAFTVLIVILLFRPVGLFGKKQINKV